LFAAQAQQNDYLPNAKLTPGAIIKTSTSTAAICVRGYARAHRVWHDKAGALAKYHIPRGVVGEFEGDDLIPVCLGGDYASPLNHWPQPNTGQWGAAAMDELEWKICGESSLKRDDAARPIPSCRCSRLDRACTGRRWDSDGGEAVWRFASDFWIPPPPPRSGER
jgi:hypothetical protein